MADISIRLHVDEMGALQAIQGVEQRLTHLTPVLEDIRERMIDSIQRNFDAGGRPTAWPVSQRARQESGKTLIRTARLKNSLTGQVQSNRVTLGTNMLYARIHQFGGTIQIPELRPRNKKALRFMIGGREVFARRVRAHAVHIPARPFLVIQEADEVYIRRVIQDYLSGQRS